MNAWIQLRRRTPAILVMLAWFELLNACATSKLFHANFDADSVGAPPATNPPGLPIGDQIWVADQSDLTVVQSPELNSKAVSYRNLNLGLWQRYVGFFSQTTAMPANQQFRASWNGRIDLTSTGSGLEIWLGDGHFAPIAAFRFKNGQVRLQTSGGSSPTYETIGSYNESETHTVFITVDRAGTIQRHNLPDHCAKRLEAGAIHRSDEHVHTNPVLLVLRRWEKRNGKVRS
jgi:hypothetical protein